MPSQNTLRQLLRFGLSSVAVASMVGPAVAVADTTLAGTYHNQPYSFFMVDSTNEITGTWGNIGYDLVVDPDMDTIQGTVNGIAVDLNMNPNIQDAQGQTDCGTMDLKYNIDDSEIAGIFCGQTFQQDFTDPGAVLPTYRQLIYQAVLGSFPQPALTPGEQFLNNRLAY